jgi:hypothetical protein
VIVSPVFLAWVMGFGKKMRIIEPFSVKEEMKKMLSDIAENYKGFRVLFELKGRFYITEQKDVWNFFREDGVKRLNQKHHKMNVKARKTVNQAKK